MQQVITTGHEIIRAWALERGGTPALLLGTETGLRFDWGEGGDELERLSWRDFFDIFEEEGMAFAHIQDDDSSVYEFIARDELMLAEGDS
ncbi:MAG: hypothetical protein JWL87_129 [Candidatus Adlerbacteria bacterium]|nr:hypothetical protein [Candidatus Adlerbacteria bacterium]